MSWPKTGVSAVLTDADLLPKVSLFRLSAEVVGLSPRVMVMGTVSPTWAESAASYLSMRLILAVINGLQASEQFTHQLLQVRPVFKEQNV